MSGGRPQTVRKELREQGRGMVGALLVVGTTFLYTMESWWLGWTLPVWVLLAYAVGGLGIVLAVTRSVGFRANEPDREGERLGGVRGALTDFAELVLQSFVVAYAMLLVFGVIELGDPWILVARLGLVEVVPLGFGAALANELLAGEKEPSDGSLANELGVFALGALFVSTTIALTEEMELIAAYMDWTRAGVLVVLSVLVVYLVLYELDTQGQRHRLQGRGKPMQFAQAFLVYGVALTVGLFLLAGFGYLRNATLPVTVQLLVVVGFPSSIGASAAEVLIG